MADTIVQLSPESPKIKEFTRVIMQGDHVLVKTHEINPDINKLLKRYGYQWSYARYAWEHRTWPALVKVEHAAAEIATLLLESGYGVEVDNGIAELVVSGEFEPEIRRWVKANDGKFVICWQKPEDCYRLALTLPSARYSPPYISVLSQYYDEVMDFAEVHKFEVLKSAIELEAGAKQARENVIMFVPKSKATAQETKIDEFAIPANLQDDAL